MKRILGLFIAIGLTLTGLEGFAQNLSNSGKEFWVGYGHHQFMETGANSQDMVLYLSTGAQPATVTVSVNNTTWTRVYNIPANTVTISDFIPKNFASDGADAMLISDPCSFSPPGTPCGGEGLFTDKGIHIQSDVPIVAYAHIYGFQSSGATMLMPVEAWGYSYITLNSKQTYAGNCYSWAYVVAQHDNTLVEIIPSQVTRAGKPANVPFYVTMNKGDIYQFMAGPENGAGAKPELTGTKIKSVANAAGDCYPIAVFSGSSRTSGTPVGCGAGSGGDNDNQQCFPSQAWGKRYLTAPTSNSTGAANFMTNTLKILIKEPGTQVYRNGTPIPMATINPAGFYIIESNQPEYITADEPIMVGQFIHGGSGCMGGGVGDPEMIYLSPLEQGIKRVGFYRNDQEQIDVNYVTLIIPTAGIASLLIDGSPTFDHSYPHPRLPGYSVVIKRWSAAKAQANISSDSAFTAITYGLGSVESYGYSAGTMINNLNAVSSIHNTLDATTAQHAYTCPNTPVEISALLAYEPTRLEWHLSALGSAVTPNTDVINTAPVSSGTVVINGITYYKYTLPGTYTFSSADTFNIPIRTFHPEVENCYNREDLFIAVIVKEKPKVDFTFTHSGCTLDPVNFSGVPVTIDDFTIRDFDWTFPGPVAGTGQNVSQILPPGVHDVLLDVVTSEGCVADTTKQITVYDKPPAEFAVTPISVCDGSQFTMTDTSSASIAVNEWYWDFGNSVTQTVTTGPSVTYTYPAPGTYTIRHVAKSSVACVSDTVTRTVVVFAPPVPAFTNDPASGCLDATGNVNFFGTATTPDGQAIQSWAWDFDDPAATPGNPNTSTDQNPSHIFQTGTYDVSLTVTTVNGCTQTTTVTLTFNAKPTVTVTPDLTICTNGSTTLTAAGATTYSWDPPIGLSATTGATVTANPTTTTTYEVIGTTNSCKDTAYVTVTVEPLPAKPIATSPVVYCQGATATALTATALPGHTLTWFDNTNLTGGSATAPVPPTTTPGTVYYYVNQTNTTTTCTGDTTRIEVTVLAPITNNTIGADQTICAGTSPAALVSTGTISGGSGTYTYQWQQSTDGGTTWTDMPAETNETLNPPATTGAIKYRRIVEDGLCSSTSNVVTIDVQGSMASFDISADQVICDGTTPALLDGQTPVGGSGTFTYVWESSADNVNWNVIAGAVSEDYQPAAISTTTYYRRKVTSGACAATSSVVTITVNPSPNGAITGNATICSYDAANITFTASAGTAPYDITLSIAGPSGTTTVTQTVPDNNPAAINLVPANSAAGTYTITLTGITDNTGCSRTTGLSSVTITVNPQPTVTVSTDIAICNGDATSLTASGATTYDWSPSLGLSAITGASVTANPTLTTTYRVIGTTNGCKDTAFVTVTVNPVPNAPVVTPAFTYCQNAPAAVLSATGDPGNTFTWYDNAALTGGTTTPYTPVTTTAGTFTYYVTQTNGFTCESEASAITVTVLPTIISNAIGADQTLCAGSPATPFSGSAVGGGNGVFSYQWQSSTDGGATWNDIAGATSVTYDAGSPAVTTQYRRIVTSDVCNSISNVVSITLQAALTNIDIASDQSICDGTTPALIDGESTIGGSGTYTYVWESSTDNVNWTVVAGATGEDYQPGAISTSTYYRRKVTSGACNATSAAVLITVNPSPNGTITGPTVMCSYDAASVTFNATAGTAPFNLAITITGPAGSTVINQVVPNNGPVSINVLPANSPAGNYTIAITNLSDATGCSRTTGLTPVNITVNPQPNVTVSAGVAICEGSNTPLVASGATTYAWSPNLGLSGITGPSVTANPTTTTTYRVIGTTNGCNDTAFVTVTVNPKPTNLPVPGGIQYCHNAAAVPLTLTPNPGNILTWYDNPGLTGGSPIAPTPSTATVGTINYYVTQTNTVTGCVSDATEISVTINPNPVVNFTLPAGICMPGGTAQFTNGSNISDNTPLTYQWNFGDGTGTSTAADPSYVYAAAGSYNVTLSATSNKGCTTTGTPQTLSDFYDKPIAQFTIAPDEICQGVNPVITEGSTAPNSTVASWAWNFDDNTPVVTDQVPVKQFANAGVFDVSLTVKNAIGCESDPFVQTVTVHLQPVIDAGRSFVVPMGTPILFEATANSPSLTFEWTPPVGLSDATILNPGLTAVADETYTLTATGDFGCTASDFITVKILKPVNVPNVFSPNGDNIHDKWMIPNLSDYPGCTVEVFNRYGQQVFYSKGYNTPWDGTWRGKELPFGAYYYVIHLQNGFKPITGSITILK